MTDQVCTRCNNRFYSAYMHGEMVCPYCGFNVKASQTEMRSALRSVVRRGCVLEAGGRAGRAETIDLSTAGAGIRLGTGLELSERDTLKVSIEGLEISSNAEVVWVRRIEGARCAGLRFVGEAAP